MQPGLSEEKRDMSKIILQVHYKDTGLTEDEEFAKIPRLGEIIKRPGDNGVAVKYRVEGRTGMGYREDRSEPYQIRIARVDE